MFGFLLAVVKISPEPIAPSSVGPNRASGRVKRRAIMEPLRYVGGAASWAVAPAPRVMASDSPGGDVCRAFYGSAMGAAIGRPRHQCGPARRQSGLDRWEGAYDLCCGFAPKYAI